MIRSHFSVEETVAEDEKFSVVGALAQLVDRENPPEEPGWFPQWLQAWEIVRAFTFEEAWYDIGTPESYLDAVA